MEGQAAHSNGNGPNLWNSRVKTLKLPKTKIRALTQLMMTMPPNDEHELKCGGPNHKKVRVHWNKVLITKTKGDTPDIKALRNYEDVVNSPEGKLWRDVMDYELAKLEEMNTWNEIDESDIPLNAQVLPGMWVHLVKMLESGERKFHSRWVIRGDKQKMNLSLSDTFSQCHI